MAPRRSTTLVLLLVLLVTVVGSFLADGQKISGEMPQGDADAPPALPKDSVDGEDSIGNSEDDGAAAPNAAPSPSGAATAGPNDLPEAGDVGLGGNGAAKTGGEGEGSKETPPSTTGGAKSGATIVGLTSGTSIAAAGAVVFAGFFGV